MVENNRQANVQEASVQVLPTSLNLFRNEQKSDRFLNFSKSASNFVRDFNIAKNGLSKMYRNYRERDDRLNAIFLEKDEILLQYVSQITASIVYLRIYDELSARNVPDSEINKFFFQCFDVNSKLSYIFRGPNKNVQEIKMLADSNGPNSKVSRYARKVFGDPPSWFKSSGRITIDPGGRSFTTSSPKQEWEQFAFQHTGFHQLLNGIIGAQLMDARSKLPGHTDLEATPDWFEKAEMNEPVLDDVKLELEEDIQEQDIQVQYLDGIDKRRNNLSSHFSEKQRKTLLRIEQKRRELESGVSNPAELVTYLHATESAASVSGDLEEIRTIDYDSFMGQINRDPNQVREEYINGLSEKLPFFQELMALWIEKKFKEARISSSEIITQELADNLSLVDDSKRNELAELKGVDKKVFALITYELKPILQAASLSEREYLTELIKSSKGESVEFLIWEIAYVAINSLQIDTSENAQKKLSEIQKFTKNWTKQNWQWAYSLLVNGREHTEEDNHVRVLNDTEEQIMNTDIQEFVQDSEKSEFQDWRIFYSTNKRVQDTSAELLTIEGSTNGEILQSLDKVLLHEGDQVSIKTQSVVNAIEWVIKLPDDIYDKRPEKIVNGEAFKKIKRGAVRILLQRDRDSKSLVFYLHQKKAFTYGY